MKKVFCRLIPKRILSMVLMLCILTLMLPMLPITALAVVTPDYGWYTANPDATVFIFSTEADIIGFRHILAGTAPGISQFNFEGTTIQLVNNIALTRELPPVEEEDRFLGDFDAQGFEITDLYTQESERIKPAIDKESSFVKDNSTSFDVGIMSGSGTISDPYIITHAGTGTNGFASVGTHTTSATTTIYYALGNNITVTTPNNHINSRRIVLDGRGFTITLNMDITGVNPRAGLFNDIRGSSNVTIRDLHIAGRAYATTSGIALFENADPRAGGFAAVVGGSASVTISRSSVNADIDAWGEGRNPVAAWNVVTAAGGFVGRWDSSGTLTVEDCFASGWAWAHANHNSISWLST